MEEKTEADMRLILLHQCEEEGGQIHWANKHGLSGQFVNDMLRGRRDVTSLAAEAMGYEKVVVFRPLVNRKEQQ